MNLALDKCYLFSWPVLTLIETAKSLGLETDRKLIQSNINNALLMRSDKCIPLSAYLSLFGSISDEVDGTDITLLVGRNSFLSGMHLQIFMSTICNTFRDYLNKMPSMLNIWGDVGEIKIESAEDDLLRLVWYPINSDIGGQKNLIDTILYLSALIIDSLCLLPIPVRRAQMTYAQPEDTFIINKSFGNNVIFDADVSAIYFDREVLDFPLVKQQFRSGDTPHPDFVNLFDGKDPADPFWPRLRQSIVTRLPQGKPKLDAVAADMNLSKRTFQRQLKDRGSDYHAELASIRQSLAENYLQDLRLTITEIAFKLGFNDHTAFSTAFKNWTNSTPGEWRKK